MEITSAVIRSENLTIIKTERQVFSDDKRTKQIIQDSSSIVGVSVNSADKASVHMEEAITQKDGFEAITQKDRFEAITQKDGFEAITVSDNVSSIINNDMDIDINSSYTAIINIEGQVSNDNKCTQQIIHELDENKINYKLINKKKSRICYKNDINKLALTQQYNREENLELDYMKKHRDIDKSPCFATDFLC
jgi:hypothetical protein